MKWILFTLNFIIEEILKFSKEINPIDQIRNFFAKNILIISVYLFSILVSSLLFSVGVIFICLNLTTQFFQENYIMMNSFILSSLFLMIMSMLILFLIKIISKRMHEKTAIAQQVNQSKQLEDTIVHLIDSIIKLHQANNKTTSSESSHPEQGSTFQ